MNPVFQFVLDIGQAGDMQIKFSNECESRTTVFAIPYAFNREFDSHYYFPGERKGSYTEFTLKYQKGGIFTTQEVPLRFSLDASPAPSDGPPRIIHLENIFPRVHRYRGKQQDVTGRFKYFLLLKPLDLLRMDQLAIENNTFLVGLTPAFGRCNTG